MFELKTYNGQFPERNRIYILNKGSNSGKPSFMPFTNSFVLTAESEDEAKLYYFICYALWKARKFHFYLVGSVIPFIRKKELLQVINAGSNAAFGKGDFVKAVQKMIDLEKLLATRQQQLKKMEAMKAAILVNYIS